jgi:hypothetical protein
MNKNKAKIKQFISNWGGAKHAKIFYISKAKRKKHPKDETTNLQFI